MKTQETVFPDDIRPPPRAGEAEGAAAAEEDLWFLPGPMDAEPGDLPPGPGATPGETPILDDWRAGPRRGRPRIWCAGRRDGGTRWR